ncbi:MAG: glycosyltransferase family 9 protein [Thermomicrobiales bacterium]
MRRIASQVRDRLLPVAAWTRRRRWNASDDTILIVQPDHLGDILLSQPAVRHLREIHPDSRLIAVVGPWSREIATIAWPVDAVVTVAFPGFTRAPAASPIAPYRQLKREARRIRALRAKSAYILRPDAWWAAWLASMSVPDVVCSDEPRTRRFATRVVTVPDHEHAALRALRIAAGAGGQDITAASSRRLCLPESADAAREANRLRNERGVAGRYLVIHPGSGTFVKEWPAARWKAVADAFAREDLRVILTGSPAEAEMCHDIASANPNCQSLAGQTSIPVLIELMRGAAAALGPDSGPLHLAVAAGTPTVHVFGPSGPRRYGPWGDPARHRVVSAGWSCPRCGDLSAARGPACGCMLAIQPAEVIDAARSVLADNA